MATDASEALAAPEIAGSFVGPRGMAKKMVVSTVVGEVGGAVGGPGGAAVGGAAASVASGDESAGAPDVPPFGRVGYLAVSADEIALVKTKTGLTKMRITDEVLARVPRGELTLAELELGWLASCLRLRFQNGVTWEFDVPKANRQTASSVVEALGGAAP